MPKRDVLRDLNEETATFLYDQKFLPELLWLLLALPVEDPFGGEKRLQVRIPRSVVFGLRKDGLQLLNDEKGYIVHKFVNVDNCMTAFPFSPNEVVAHEREICVKGVNGDNATAFTYQGMYNTALSYKAYRRLISNTFKHIQAHTHRNFWIREHVKTRHEKYKKNPFKRVVYRLYGKTTVLSITAKEEISVVSKPKPKLVKNISVAKKNWKNLLRGISSSEAEERIKHANKSPPKEDKQKSEKKRYVLRDAAEVISYQNFRDKQEIASMDQMERIEELARKEQLKVEMANKAASDKKKQENAWYYDAEEEEQDDPDDPEFAIRALEDYDHAKYQVTEMHDLAAADLVQLMKLIVEHINSLTQKQLSTLVIDFVKDSEDKYVLNEIIAFQFDQNEGPSQGKRNAHVARRPMLVKYRIESFFQCDLDEITADIDAKEGSTADDDHDTEEVTDMRACIAAALKARALTIPDAADFQTPNTVLCRMCNSRINSTSSRYHVTSTMIYSTVMHIRARIPSHEWPSFCSDNSYTLLSMQRNIKSLIGEGTALGTATEANLFLCSSCYRLYQEETNLVQLEHQIGVLTKNQGLKSSNCEGSMFSSSIGTKSQQSSDSPKKGVISAGEVKTSPKLSMASSARQSNPRPSSAPSVNGRNKTYNSPSSKLSLFSLNSNRPSIDTVHTRIKTGSLASVKSGSSRKSTRSNSNRSTEKSGPKSRDTVYQLSRPRQLTETYAEKFLRNEKSPSELLSDSDIRDKFRDKNKPSNHTVPFFIGNDKKKKSSSTQVVHQEIPQMADVAFPKVSDPPMGNVVSRTDLPLHITVCRLAVNLHEVVNLPVAIFEAYENFSLAYVALGRRVDASCEKGTGFNRYKENKFKVARPFDTDNIGQEDSYCSSTSSTSSSLSSSTTSSSSTNTSPNNEKVLSSNVDRESKKDEAKSISDTDSDTDAFESSCESVDNEVVVGSLQCRFFKVSYVMITGDAQSHEYHEPLTQFFQDFKHITVVLCATLKPTAAITENNWIVPDINDLSKSKASRFKSKIRDIKRIGSTDDDDSLKPLPRRRPSSSSVSYKPQGKDHAPRQQYDPRSKRDYTTESGMPLPGNAIAYGHIPLDQFKGNTVRKLDVGTPLTYTIQHLPRARTIPMLKGMVGFDRPLYPIDTWALPYSMLRLRERNAFVPLVENQYSTTIPLPSDWVNVKMANLDARRGKATFKSRNSITGISGSMSASAGSLRGTTIRRIDIDSMKRNAPTLHSCQARNEVSQMVSEKNNSSFNIRKRYEIDLERQPGSIWCICVQVLSAHHIHSDDDFFSQSKRSFECVFQAFGDKTRLIGDVVEADEEGGEVKFISNETKFLFSSSISALEHMFDTMDPVILCFRPLEDNPDNDLPQYARTLSVADMSRRRRSLLRSSKCGEMKNSLHSRKSCGKVNFQNLHKERFMEISIPVVNENLSSSMAHKNEMYPPYAHVILKLYRVGPPTIEECGDWLPPRMTMGHEVDRGVRRVQYAYRM